MSELTWFRRDRAIKNQLAGRHYFEAAHNATGIEREDLLKRSETFYRQARFYMGFLDSADWCVEKRAYSTQKAS